jgi:hypothetical protein
MGDGIGVAAEQFLILFAIGGAFMLPSPPGRIDPSPNSALLATTVGSVPEPTMYNLALFLEGLYQFVSLKKQTQRVRDAPPTACCGIRPLAQWPGLTELD